MDDPDSFDGHAYTRVKKRITLINERGVLGHVSAVKIRDTVDELALMIDIREEGGSEQIVSPRLKSALKRILRFLNEYMHSRPIAEGRYASASKRLVEDG